MTKRRPPVSIERALFKVLGELGIDRAAEVTGREPDYLRSMSDPDTRYQLSVADALKLDLAHRAERQEPGVAVYPIYEAYGLLLDTEGGARFADAEAIHRQAAAVAKEGGEATAALIRASLPSATPADDQAALRQLEESIAADTVAIQLISTKRTQGGPAP